MKFLTKLALSSTSSKRRRRQRQFEEVAAAAYVKQSKVEPTAATSNSGSDRNNRNNRNDSSSSSSNNSNINNSKNRRNIAPLPKYPFLKENPQYLLKMCQHGDWKHIQRCCDIMKEIILQQNSNNNSNRNHKEERRHHDDDDDDDDHLLVLIPCCRQQFLQRTAESDDGHQNTPLHVLCKRDQVPVEVLTSFLGAIDSLQWWNDNKDHQHHQHQYQHPLWIENADGETPLLVACRTGAGMAVIRALVQTPEGAQAITLPDEQRMTPIAALVHRFEMNSEFSLRPSTTTNNTMASPKRLSLSSSSFADNDARTVSTTSTGITTSSSSSISSSTMLYNESDHQHHHYDEDDEDYPSLVSVSSSSSEESSRVVVAGDDDDKTTTSTTSSLPILLIEDLIRVAWEHSAPRSMMELLDDDDYHYYTPLHGAAWIADCLPTHLLEEFIQTYGGEQSSRSSSSSSHHHHHFKQGDDPFCPLHVALLARRIPRVDQKRRSQSSSLPPPLPGSNTNPTMTLQRTHAIRRLVAANPVAVQCPVVVVTRGRRHERSVLATAIASGLSWHQQVGRAEEEGSTVIIVGPLQTLFHAHPTALLERDSDSKLLPFQLAAAAAAGGATVTVTTTNMKMGMVRILDDEATTLQVDTIYNLLRQAPQQLIFTA